MILFRNHQRNEPDLGPQRHQVSLNEKSLGAQSRQLSHSLLILLRNHERNEPGSSEPPGVANPFVFVKISLQKWTWELRAARYCNRIDLLKNITEMSLGAQSQKMFLTPNILSGNLFINGAGGPEAPEVANAINLIGGSLTIFYWRSTSPASGDGHQFQQICVRVW